MKFTTRARYGLRMMIELARLQQQEKLIQLRRIAKITGLSNNYLAQLAIFLKDDDLIIGISGKNGGYRLARPANKITLREIIRAVHGPIYATECVINPAICLNAEFCESRMIWALITHQMQEVLEKYTLADMVDHNWIKKMKEKYPDATYLHPDRMLKNPENDILFTNPATCQRVAPERT